MPQVGFLIEGREVPFEEAYRLALAGVVNYPYPLLRALASDRCDDTPSASSIGGCLREFEWKRTHDYYSDPDRGLAAMFGTGVHAVLATNPGHTAQTERGMSASVEVPGHGPMLVRGTVDHVDPAIATVTDWKTKIYLARRGFSPDPKHIIQVHIYAWLWASSSVGLFHPPLENWRIVYLDQKNVQTFTGKLRPLAGVQAYIAGRLKLWADAKAAGELPPPCDNPYCNVCRKGAL